MERNKSETRIPLSGSKEAGMARAGELASGSDGFRTPDINNPTVGVMHGDKVVAEKRLDGQERASLVVQTGSVEVQGSNGESHTIDAEGVE